MRKIIALATILVMILGVQGSGAGWLPDYALSTATRTYQGPEMLTLLIMPDGSGNPFTEAGLPPGGMADATITVTLVDPLGVPVEGYPYEDIWLWSPTGVMAACQDGACADHNTDANGETVFLTPMRAGGHSDGLCQVLVNGSPLLSGDLQVAFVSPDMNGDLRVDLSDVGIFTADYYTGYSFRTDLQVDGVINLSDLGLLASSLGISCP